VTDQLLEQRYGVRKTSNPKLVKRLAIAAVALLTLIAGLFGLANYNPVSHVDVGFRVLSDYRIAVDFELTKPKQSTVVCSIEALNNQFFQVGWAEFEFGPSEYMTLRHTVQLNTTELAVTGLVERCRLR
jgi:hypothetical protein